MEVNELIKLMAQAGEWGFEIRLNSHRSYGDIPSNHVNYNGAINDNDKERLDLTGEKDVCMITWDTSSCGHYCIIENSVEEAMMQFIKLFDVNRIMAHTIKHKENAKECAKIREGR